MRSTRKQFLLNHSSTLFLKRSSKRNLCAQWMVYKSTKKARKERAPRCYDSGSKSPQSFFDRVLDVFPDDDWGSFEGTSNSPIMGGDMKAGWFDGA